MTRQEIVLASHVMRDVVQLAVADDFRRFLAGTHHDAIQRAAIRQPVVDVLKQYPAVDVRRGLAWEAHGVVTGLDEGEEAHGYTPFFHRASIRFAQVFFALD